MDHPLVAVSDIYVPATDGHPLAATRFEAREARALVLVNAATGVPRGYYAKFAHHVASHGATVVTYDYRGIGGSRPASLRRFPATMSDWGTKDLAGVLAWTEKEYADLPVVAVGHSAGGQILPLAEGAARIRALYGVASQSGHWRHWPAPARYRRWLDWHLLVPSVATAWGRLPAWALGTEIPEGVAKEWARWCRHREYVVQGLPARRSAYADWKGRIRALSFSDDAWGPPASVDGLLALYPNATREHIRHTPATAGGPVGHFGFFKERHRATLWDDAAAWLLAQAG